MIIDDLEGKQVEIPLHDHEGYIQDYLEHLSKSDKHLAQKLIDMGLPSEGYFRLTTTPGDNYGAAFKDFTVKSFATLLGNLDDLDPSSLGGMHNLSGPDVWRVWRIWLMDIFHEGFESHIRYVWNQATGGGVVTIENINTDLQTAKNNRIKSTVRSVIPKLERLLPGLKIIEVAKARSRGRIRGSGKLDNVDDDSLIDIYAYLWAKSQRDNLDPPTQYDLAGWLGVDRSTVWRRIEGQLDWDELREKGKERAKDISFEKLEEFLKQI